MPFTAEELEAMRLADEEIEREFEESYSAQYADAEISKWLDEQAINDTLDHKQLHKKRQQRAYRKRKRQQEYMIAAEIKNTAPDTAMSESGT